MRVVAAGVPKDAARVARSRGDRLASHCLVRARRGRHFDRVTRAAAGSAIAQPKRREKRKEKPKPDRALDDANAEIEDLKRQLEALKSSSERRERQVAEKLNILLARCTLLAKRAAVKGFGQSEEELLRGVDVAAEIAELIGEMGGTDSLILAAKNHPMNEEVQASTAGASGEPGGLLPRHRSALMHLLMAT